MFHNHQYFHYPLSEYLEDSVWWRKGYSIRSDIIQGLVYNLVSILSISIKVSFIYNTRVTTLSVWHIWSIYFFRIQLFTLCLTLMACLVYLLRKGIQSLKDRRDKKRSQVVEMKLAPIRNLVQNQSTINNKAVNDKIVTSAKMFLIFAFVALFVLLTYFYTSYFVQVAHKVNIVNLFSIINRFVFTVIFPSIMYINNVSLRNFVFYGVKNLIWK